MDIPRTARFAGVVYLAFALLSIFGFAYVPATLTVTGDATATAEAIRASEALYRAGVLAALVAMVLFIVLVITLYGLFRSTNAGLARLMVALVVVGVAAEFFTVTLRLGVLILLSDSGGIGDLASRDSDAAAYALVRFQGQASSAIQLFWGLWLFPFAALVIQSRLMPRILGVLLLLAGVAYTMSSVFAIVAPESLSALAPLLTLLAAGELPIILWLLVRGARVPLSPGVPAATEAPPV